MNGTIKNGRKQGHPVTVCIAARCKEGMIFCAADRMVTTGDLELEQATPKIIQLTTSICLMMSDDDATLHARFCKTSLGE